MTKPGAPGSGSPRRKGLSAEDEALWELASSAYEPLKGAKPRVHERTGNDQGMVRPDRHPLHASVPSVRAHGHPPPARPVQDTRPPTSPARIPPLAEFDRRKAKKIAAGREVIEGRIDLHGMRQSEAHAALRAFLLSSHANGRRNVLIITGKGGPRREDREPESFMDTRERGVLKRNVPMWLAEPELRAIVVSYREAAQSHGGAGALYVHLRALRNGGD